MILQFLLMVIIAGILYMKGEKAAQAVRRFAWRLAGEKGENAVLLASDAIRAVALGVVVTALAQSAVAGIGPAVCSVPGALLLTSAVLVLCLAQLGPILIMLPATIWKFYTGDTVWAGALLLFTIVSGTMDAFPIRAFHRAFEKRHELFSSVPACGHTMQLAGLHKRVATFSCRILRRWTF